MKGNVMFQLILQLHITGQCNLRCKHCYISEHAQELSIDTIKNIFFQLSELVNELERVKSKKFPVSIHITGGEPLCHSEIHTILDMLFEQRSKYRIGIMSNGTMLDDDTLIMLSKLNLKALQVSLDGCCETHDKIRGNGNFLSVLHALDLLYQYGIPSRVSFTANKENYIAFPFVADICRRHHVKSLWSDRIIPFENNSAIKPIDNESDMKKYVDILANEKNNEQNKLFGLRIDNHRALQFIGTDDNPYWCTAGEQLITVDEYGNVIDVNN